MEVECFLVDLGITQNIICKQKKDLDKCIFKIFILFFWISGMQCWIKLNLCWIRAGHCLDVVLDY